MLVERCKPGVAVIALIALVASLSGGARVAHAQNAGKKKIAQKLAEAMEYYDLLEYEEARKHLNLALAVAKRADLEKDPITAQVYLRLGIVYFAGLQDRESAALNFSSAVEIDPAVQIDAAYKTGEMEAALEEARASVAGGEAGQAQPVIDCGGVSGLEHTLVDTAALGAEREVVLYAASDLDADKIALHYRPQGAADFTEVVMKKSGECKYVGTVPGEAVAGDFVHYYVAAYRGDEVVANRGSDGAPNIIEVAAAGAGGTLADDENPLGDGDTAGSIDATAATGASRATFFFSVAVGSGGGYVTGETEQENSGVECCFAPALLHVFPEIGYYVSSKLSVSLALRMGFPIGANLMGHATAAPSGVVRMRYTTRETGTGLALSGAIGGGIIRHTVKLKEPVSEQMDTDTVASGPLILGAGVGYIASLGGPIRFIAELNALAGVPVIDELGTCPGSGCVRPNLGVQMDANLGLMFAF